MKSGYCQHACIMKEFIQIFIPTSDSRQIGCTISIRRGKASTNSTEKGRVEKSGQRSVCWPWLPWPTKNLVCLFYIFLLKSMLIFLFWTCTSTSIALKMTAANLKNKNIKFSKNRVEDVCTSTSTCTFTNA